MSLNFWSDRDTAVAPWTGPCKSLPPSIADSASHHQLAHRRCKILTLLSARERVGLKAQCGRIGWLSEGASVTNDGLAGAGAWNARRLQNMTLAIGPSTPASCVLPATAVDDTSSQEEDEEEEGDDDEEELDEMPQEAGSDDANAAVARAVGDTGEANDAADDEKFQNQGQFEGLEGSVTEVPTDAEAEGQLAYPFNDSVRLVRDDHDTDDSFDDTSEQVGSCAPDRRLVTQSPRDQKDAEDCGNGYSVDDEYQHHCGRTGRRARWEQKQQSILDALNGVGDEQESGSENDAAGWEDCMDDSSEGSHHTNMENAKGSGSEDNKDDDISEVSNFSSVGGGSDRSTDRLTERDRSNIRQVERYIDHLEGLHRRRGWREGHVNESSSRNQPQGLEREVARSMRHGGCINTVSWLDCGWRISTASQNDADLYQFEHYHDVGDDEESSHTSGNCFRHGYDDLCPHQTLEYRTPSHHLRRLPSGVHGGLVAPLTPKECPTQLITSGDDHLVKFWDVSVSMGSASPLPCSATATPFSSPKMPVGACAELVDGWRSHSTTVGLHHRYLPGIVHPLLTLSTGHRGNVFHATPVPHSPGKIATCAADGYLRLLDVEYSQAPAGCNRVRSNSTASSMSNTGESSAIIVSPEYQTENGEEPTLRFHSSLMCFSHHFLSANVGLVCCERGLLHFDIRLPPRSQQRGSLVPELRGTCKACYPWRLGSVEGASEDELESAYVFAGGSGVDVGLYDLRMTGSSKEGSSQAMQKYRPRDLRRRSSVAVSGIDLSKDRRELLVSYESDHVYTFPIFPEAVINSGGKKADRHVPELAAYGGHLNRLTFLKMAQYAGPNDEYICTGSDSGHAWIYEKQTGTVAGLMKADNSTCNGIQPHPTLPYFITYGIDSTAKLWRATIPVDTSIDDSDIGRFNYSKKVKYEKTVVAEQWKKARRGKEVDLNDEDLSFFPDETAEDDNDDSDHFLGIFIRSRLSQDAAFVGNDLKNLCAVLARNYFTCARAVGSGGDEPVKSGLSAMKRRTSLIKMRHQADRLGLEFSSRIPYKLRHKEYVRNLNKDVTGDGDMVLYGCLADLIPDNPSDWIPFDELLASPPHPRGMHFNTKYERYRLETQADPSVTPVRRACPIELTLGVNKVKLDPVEIVEIDHDPVKQSHPMGLSLDAVDSKKVKEYYLINLGAHGDAGPEDNEDILSDGTSKQPFSVQSHEFLMRSAEGKKYDPAQAWGILLETVALLKDSGNEALKESLPSLAARRYDKAINYCSVAYLNFPVGNVLFLAEHQYTISKNSGFECLWNELLKMLVMIRLNLAVCFLKEEIDDAKGAAAQATMGLKELKPFVAERGVVLIGKRLTKKRPDEPPETFAQAKALQAKAYFRLGSAQLAMGEYNDAVKSFESCMDSTKDAGMSVDGGVLRKINEAKRRRREKKESQRKKFKKMFSPKNDESYQE